MQTLDFLEDSPVARQDTFAGRLERLDLTTGEAAWLLGTTRRAVQKWAIGENEPPEPIRRLLDVIEHVPAAKRHLERLAYNSDVPYPPQRRGGGE